MSEKEIGMHNASRDPQPRGIEKSAAIAALLDDFSGERNLVRLYDLLLRIDRRVNSHLYTERQPV